MKDKDKINFRRKLPAVSRLLENTVFNIFKHSICYQYIQQISQPTHVSRTGLQC